MLGVNIDMNISQIVTFLLRGGLACFLLVLLLSCTRNVIPRDMSHVLLGHWETIDGKEHYYVSSDEITFYFAKEDRLATSKYMVLQQYPSQRTIEIRIQVQGSNDFKEINDRKFVFSDDYKVAEVHLTAGFI